MLDIFFCNAYRRLRYILFSALAIGFIGLAAMAVIPVSTVSPDLNEFVVFAKEEIVLSQDSQVSSGNIGTNGKLVIDQNSLITADLFADELSLDAGVQVNGNISFNELNTHPNAVIFGATTTPVAIPIAILPDIPDFDPGTQDSTFSGSGNILAAGSYNNIKLKKDSKLTLSGGTYYLNSLELEKNSTLIYATPTVLNIKNELTTHQNVAVLPGQDLKPDDLVINCEADEIDFEKDSFLNFKLLAPQAKVKINQGITLRGQILAGEIEVDRDVVLSRDESFTYVTSPENIITDSQGAIYAVNEVLLNMADGTTLADVLEIAEFIGGQAVGIVDTYEIYQILVSTQSEAELAAVFDVLENLNDPRMDGMYRNYKWNFFSTQFDLENLKKFNAELTQAYDSIFVQEAWDAVLKSGVPLNSITVGVVEDMVEPEDLEFKKPEVDLGTYERQLEIIANFFRNSTTAGFPSHGTFVTSVIGANNVSDSPSSPLFPLSENSPQMNGILSGVLDESQYTIEIMIKKDPGITLVIDVFMALRRVAKADPVAINMSWGWPKCSVARPGQECLLPGGFIYVGQQFIEIFNDNSEILFVAAAGNHAVEASEITPANLSYLDNNNVITVGAVDRKNQRLVNFQGEPGSNFGALVDLAAVGEDVYVTNSKQYGIFPLLG